MNPCFFTADLHLTSRASDARRWHFFPWLVEQAKKRNVDAIFILGDLTDAKDHHSSKLVNRIVNDLTFLESESGAEVICLMGNHDYTDPTCPFFRFAHWFVYTIETVESGGSKILLIPHQKDWSVAQEKIDKTGSRFILCHQLFRGAKQGAVTLDGGDVATFPVGKIVIAGDVHQPQRLGPVRYCGAPYHINFGDTYEPRILYWNGERLKSIKYKEGQRKYVIEVTSVDDAYDKLKGIPNLNPWDQLKIRLRLPRSEFGSWETYREELRALETKVDLRGIELQEIEGEKRETFAPKHQTDPLELLSSYCEAEDIEPELERVGRELMDV